MPSYEGGWSSLGPVGALTGPSFPWESDGASGTFSGVKTSTHNITTLERTEEKMESEIDVKVSWSKLIISAGIGAMVAGIGYFFFKTYHRR